MEMRKASLITVILCLLFTSQIHQVFAVEQNSTKEIERIEVKDGMKITYYTDGTREIFVTFIENINAQTSVSTVSHTIYIPPNWWDITERIFKIINQFLKTLAKAGIGSFLLAWEIWNIIKSLRRGRPRDYYGVGNN